MPILYTTKASATGGRAGRAVSENGVLDVTLTVRRNSAATAPPAPIRNSSSPPAIPPASSAR